MQSGIIGGKGLSLPRGTVARMTNKTAISGPMSERVAQLALEELGPLFHRAAHQAWPKYVESLRRIDDFSVGPASKALLLRDAVLHEFHPLMEPLVNSRK